MYATTIAALPSACPQCETELDQISGVCPACRWDAQAAQSSATAEPVDDERSFVDRYRGTEYDLRAGMMEATDDAPNRTRLLLGVGLVGLLGLFYFVGQSLFII